MAPWRRTRHPRSELAFSVTQVRTIGMVSVELRALSLQPEQLGKVEHLTFACSNLVELRARVLQLANAFAARIEYK
jgi:hypothetical protein